MVKVIVIGAGPAGLMAAGIAAKKGYDVVVLEKELQPLKKFRITGKGQCNFTNAASKDDFLSHIRCNSSFFDQVFSQFSNVDLMQFFKDIGIEYIVERGERVFPSSKNAVGAAQLLQQWVRSQGVRILTNSPVSEILVKTQRVYGVKTQKKGRIPSRQYQADYVVLATGGITYPKTGSTGDGYAFLQSVGHTIIPVRPALVPLTASIDPALVGLNLRNVNASLIVDGEKRRELFGEMLFIKQGVSGPIILSLSRDAVDAIIKKQSVIISIDLKPNLTDEQLENRISREQQVVSSFGLICEKLLPKSLLKMCLDQTGIAPSATSFFVAKLISFLRNCSFHIGGYGSLDSAIITAGGIDLSDINVDTMASKLVSGLYIAGEVLDLDADTGGYNLQIAFSTAWVAGHLK